MRRPNLRDPDIADAIRAERRDESTHHKACFEAAHSVDDDAELERVVLLGPPPTFSVEPDYESLARAALDFNRRTGEQS